MSYLIVSLVCTGILVTAFLSYLVITIIDNQRNNRAVMLLTGVALAVALTRTVTVAIAIFQPDLVRALRWNTAYEFSLLLLLPLIPNLLTSLVPSENTASVRFHRRLTVIGAALAAFFAVLLFAFPRWYQIPDDPALIPHPAGLGRGNNQPAYMAMNGAFMVLFLYTQAFVLKNRIVRKGRGFLTTLNLGMAVSTILALNIIWQVFTGEYIAGYPIYAFSRLIVTLTVFCLTAVIAEAQRAAEESRFIRLDRTEVIRNRDELARVAYIDEMTGLANRQALFRDVRGRFGTPSTLLMLDIDNLAYVNAYLGYTAGDELIRRVAALCRRYAPEGSTVYRVNADTFAVLTGLDTDDAERMSGELLKGVRELILVPEDEVRFTASAGIASASGPPTWEDWINRVNTALEAAKVSRNRCVVFNPDLHEDEKRRQSIISGLRRPVDDNGFSTLYQPIVTRDGTVVGAEVLLRWIHPVLGPVGPSEFIPLAEATGLVSRLTQAIIRRSLEDFHHQSPLPPGWRTSVNLSGRDMTDGHFLDQLDGIISEYPGGEDYLGFEVTETDLIAEWDQSLANLNGIRDRGFSIALDDFGTGYSNLSYLNRLPLDKLKIDRSFLTGIPGDNRQTILLNTMLNLGRNLGLDLVMEGVENEDQLRYLVDRDCRLFQGYYFARPMPIDEFRNWTQTRMAAGA